MAGEPSLVCIKKFRVEKSDLGKVSLETTHSESVEQPAWIHSPVFPVFSQTCRPRHAGYSHANLSFSERFTGAGSDSGIPFGNWLGYPM